MKIDTRHETIGKIHATGVHQHNGNVRANFMRHLITLIFILYSLTLYGQKTENLIKMDTVYSKNPEDGWCLIGIHSPSYRNCNRKHCNGLLIDTFQNGQIKECAFYINGQIRGPFIEYYESGQIKANGAYDSSGHGIGTHVDYFSNGKIERTATFKNKKRIKFQSYFNNGKLESYQELNSGYFLKFDFEFNELGDTLSAHILTDSVNLIYRCWLKFDNGKYQMIGDQKFSNPGWTQIWMSYYDEKGKLIKTETNKKN